MRIGIVGAGFIGRAIAKLATVNGYEVMISNSRGPQTLASTAASIGCQTGTVSEAANFGEIVVITIPFVALTSLSPSDFSGKIVLDTNNYYEHRDGKIEGFDENINTTGEYLQKHLVDARIVKAFNAILERDILSDSRPKNAADRRALPIAGDDPEAKRVVTKIMDALGFDAVDVGPMSESWRFERGMPSYCIQLNESELKDALSAAKRGERAALGSWRVKRRSLSQATAADETSKGISGRGDLDIVDAQIHLMPDPDLRGTIAAMDALGIRTVIVDEFWSRDEDGRVHPSIPLSNGSYRPIAVSAIEGALKYPKRFAFVQRVMRSDPDAARIVEDLSALPGCVGVRVILSSKEERQQFATGGWDSILETAAKFNMPVDFLSKDLTELVSNACNKFPDLKLIAAHCGWCSNAEQWDALLKLAKLPNLYLKWSHADRTFQHFNDPSSRMGEGLREAISAFGAERVMWASDVTHEETPKSWFQLLEWVYGSPDLSAEERTQVLGSTARKLYGLGA